MAHMDPTSPERTLLISFSGIDGSGKSTQIENLRTRLCELGLSTRMLAFWDDVVVLSRYREGFVHKVYKSERGIGAPDKPVNRRDKNMRGWHLTAARHLLYLLDAVHLRFVVARARRIRPGVIIMDRYIYDELANLPLGNPLSRALARVADWLVPRPDVAFLLDADPDAARARKPEYPVEFMRECRQWYFRLASLLGYMTIVPPLPIAEAKARVEESVWNLLQNSPQRNAIMRLRESA
jgi:thymidylate kinase